MAVNLAQQVGPDGVGYVVPFEPGRCKACVAWFQKPGALMKHHRLVHSNIVIKFECSMCDRAFTGPHAALCPL